MDSTFFDMTADLPLRLESLDMPTSAQTDAFGLVNSFCTGNPFAAWQPKSPEPYFGNSPYSPSTTPSSPASSVGTAYESETHESDPEFVADFRTPDEVLQRACPTAQEEDRLCLNCWTAETPLWRRNDNGFFLCNACGLFLKTYGKNRTPPKERRVPAKKPKALAAIEIECFNCKTTETSLWRRGENNCALCNACGLYWKIHGSDRPLKMNKKAGPRRRQRVWRAPSEKSKPYSTVPASKNNSPVATRKSSDARIAAEVPALSTRPSSPIPKEEPASPVLSPVAASASVSPVATAVPSVALPPPLLFGAPAASLPMFPGQYSTLPTSVNTGAQLGMPLLDPSLLAQQMLLAGNPFAAMAAPTLPLNNSALTAAATTQQFLTSAAMAFSLMSMQPMAMQQLTFGMPAFGGFGMDLVQKAVENLDSQVQALKEYTRQQALMAQQQQGF